MRRGSHDGKGGRMNHNRESDDLASQDTCSDAVTADCSATEGSAGAARFVPVLVEKSGRIFGVIWVHASASELVPGAEFTVNGRRWVIIGISPSGVTFTGREVTGK
jgi:hypothetical protein